MRLEERISSAMHWESLRIPERYYEILSEILISNCFCFGCVQNPKRGSTRFQIFLQYNFNFQRSPENSFYWGKNKNSSQATSHCTAEKKLEHQNRRPQKRYLISTKFSQLPPRFYVSVRITFPYRILMKRLLPFVLFFSYIYDLEILQKSRKI